MLNKTATLRWGFGGVIWGTIIAFCSIAVAGGGHGWVSALPFGLLAVFTTPLVTIAFARKNLNGRKLAMIALGIAVISDVLLLSATLNEGTEYFYKVFLMWIIWILLWSSWQVLTFIILFSKN